MMDRVDSTPARRLAVRGALSLSKLLPILLVACVVRAESGSSTTVSCPPDEESEIRLRSRQFGGHRSIAEDPLGHQ